MANIKSAKKRVVTSQVRADRNKAIKSRRLTLLLRQRTRLLQRLLYQLQSLRSLRLLLREFSTRTQLQERFLVLQRLLTLYSFYRE